MAHMRHQILRRLLAGLVSAVLLAAPLGAAAAEPAAAENPALAIYTTGDMAGRVFREDPLTGEETDGYQNVAAAMAAERAAGTRTLLLDSGDAVDNGLARDGGQAEALALRAIGYDALIPAEGEFRLGPEARESFFRTLSHASDESDAAVRVLSGNYLNVETQEPAAEPYAVFTRELGGREIRIGVLGLGAMDAAERLPASFLEGVSLSHPGNTENSYAWEWTHFWQARLEEEGCDLVVVVCHADRDTLTQFAAQTTGIDLLVGGHGPAEAVTLENADGEPVAYVNSGGRAVTRTVVTLDEAGQAALGESSLLPLSNYEPDDALAEQLGPELTETSQQLQTAVGTLAGDWTEEGSLLHLQSHTADLEARAMLWASGADAVLLSPSEFGSLSLAGCFTDGEDTAQLTLADCARLLPGTAPLVVVELTGAQLRQWLDQGAELYEVEADGSISGGGDADVLYGMDYALYLGSPAGERVDGLTFHGTPVADAQTFRVAISADRLDDLSLSADQILWSSAQDDRFAAQSGLPAAVLAAYLSLQTYIDGDVTPQRDSTWVIYTGAVNGPLTRLEFVTMLYELAGKPTPGASAAFIDVSNSPAAVWAAETGVVSGNGQGSFLPTQVITREQAAVMLYNYARSRNAEMPQSGVTVDSMLDGGEIASWARPAVEFCLRTGTLTAAGTRGDLFLPRETITRTEAAQALDTLSAYLR